jgi:hypothetical protein
MPSKKEYFAKKIPQDEDEKSGRLHTNFDFRVRICIPIVNP